MCDPTAFCHSFSWAFSFTLTYRHLLPRTRIYDWVMSLFKSGNVEHVKCSQTTNHHSRSGRCQAEAGTQEGSRVHCVPGTSISLHLHISLLPTWWKGSQWKGEDILRDTDIFHWFLVSWWMQQGCVGSMENERNGISKPSPTTLLLLFLLFDLQLPCLFNLPLCSLWLFTVVAVFPFHPLRKE